VAGRAGAVVSAGAVLKVALAGAARRPVQTVVIFAVLATATTAALVGLTLATNPTQADQAVSTRYHVADLAVTIEATKVTSAELARAHHLPGVTKAVGYPATTVNVTIPATPGYRGGTAVSGPLTIVGRALRAGPIAVPEADLAGGPAGRDRRVRHAADAGQGTGPRPRDT